ncbi:MAG: DUF3365 domain-containing protein [Blastocatellia bacterium]|nr:DUF3365 domain-containing protein [Blastocatellia bacterium]
MRTGKGVQLTIIALTLGLGSWLSVGSASVASQRVDTEAAVAEARKISAELTDQVRGLLVEELGKGGYDGAVKVCAEVAQDIPRQFTKRTGHYLRRVSLGYRNRNDIPDQYERKKLKFFESQNREKKLAADDYEVVKEKGQSYLRYMKPLVASAMCVKCHGPKAEIAEPVRKILQEKYPQDRAFGYQAGDVRGAISVKIKLDAIQK